MPYGLASDVQVAQFAAEVQRLPAARQQLVLAGLVAKRDQMFGTPLENLRGYAERNDPQGFARDIFGVEPTQQQDEQLELLERKDAAGQQAHNRFFIHSGTNVGKTAGGAWWLGYRAFAVSQLINPDDGLPQGAMVLLAGPQHDQIADTIWSEFLKSMDRAADRGYPFKAMFNRPPRPTRADWMPTDTITFRSIAPPKSARHAARHSVSGRHSENMVAIGEEVAAIDEGILERLETGFTGPGNTILLHGNPDPSAPSGPAYERYVGSEYVNIGRSCLDWPNVLERRRCIGGGSQTHESMDAAIRVNCEDLGQRQPEKAHFDIRYALPEKGASELGPREDGERGMAGCEVRTYRPNVKFIAGKLGEFPLGAGDCPFDVSSLDASVQRWKEGVAPDRPADRWGIDPALEGPDTASAAPAWGTTLDELWYAVWDRPKEIPALIEAGGRYADGEWVAVVPTRVGLPVSLGSGRAPVIAAEAQSTCGKIPVICDRGGESNAVFEHMDSVLGMNVTPVRFGEDPERLLPGETPAFNRRVQLYLRFADLLSWGLVDLPPSEKIRRAALAQQKDYSHDVYRQVPGAVERVKVVKLLPKRKIRAAAGDGLDDLEACILACQRADTGGFEMTTF